MDVFAFGKQTISMVSIINYIKNQTNLNVKKKAELQPFC